MKLSVIVPMFNEEQAIARCLEAVRGAAPQAEILVVDGGSEDRSTELARPRCDRLIAAPRGRAAQMNAGAKCAAGECLIFLHADTIVPPTFASDITKALADSAIAGGRFDVELDDDRPLFRVIGFMISERSRLSRTATGDQAIFVRRAVFERLGGFAQIPICEDLEFTRRLKRAGAVACLRSRVRTSARRWQSEGVLATIVRMWAIRLLYLAGVPPELLKRHYTDPRGGQAGLGSPARAKIMSRQGDSSEPGSSLYND